MARKKYKLMKAEFFVPSIPGWNNTETVAFRRIKALRTISPDVKAGTIGGYVSNERTLSQTGTSWIHYGALVYGEVSVQDSAQVKDNAIICNSFDNKMILLSGNASVEDNAFVVVTEDAKEGVYSIRGNASITENARVYDTPTIDNNVFVAGNALIKDAKLSGDACIDGDAVLIGGNLVRGTAHITGNALLRKGSSVSNAIIGGRAIIDKDVSIVEGIYEKEGVFISSPVILKKYTINGEKALADVTPPLGDDESSTMSYYHEVMAKIAAYETDIVKIIKYPLMTDRTNDYTLHMITALNKAQRLTKDPTSEKFEDAVADLEAKFLAAESNASKISLTLLSEAEVKKTIKAKDLFSIASDDASTEHEKKVAFVQGFKQLEGVINVPEIAMDTFRGKIGLKEIEE